MIRFLSLALVLAATPVEAAAQSQSFGVVGATAWYDYQIDSSPAPKGRCKLHVWREKGGTGEPAAVYADIELHPGQTLTFTEAGLKSQKLILRCRAGKTTAAVQDVK